MRFSSLNEWLRWQEGLHPKAIDLGLARVKQVAQNLGLLTPDAKVITVAGTNGKGSCVATLACLLGAAGKRFGAYTSPHILNYNERVSVNGTHATDEQLCAAFEAIDQARGEISLSYFEFGTLAAFYIFSKEPLDYWLLEVGLGGRLDAANIIDPQLTIITSIDIDHVDWLGDNRESIGYEKAGICREFTPLICADPSPPKSVLTVANELDCPLYLLGRHFGFEQTASGLTLWGQDFSYSLTHLGLPFTSVLAALQAMHLLGFSDQLDLFEKPLNFSVLLEQLSLPGRLQVRVSGESCIVLDVAHNPAAMTHLVTQLGARYPNKRFAVVLAMMHDKNTLECVGELEHVAGSWLVSSINGLPRAAKAADLRAQVCQVDQHANVTVTHSVSEALKKAMDSGVSHILVTGSFYTVSEASQYLDTKEGSSDG